jgi:hypothetical protein
MERIDARSVSVTTSATGRIRELAGAIAHLCCARDELVRAECAGLVRELDRVTDVVEAEIALLESEADPQLTK